MSCRKRVAGRLLLAASLCALVASAVGGCLHRSDRDARPPNLVVIVTDDQTVDQFSRRTMPATHRLLVDEGISFTDYVVTSPLCCPSRASFLTGQYVHNNGVVSNTYLKLKGKRNVLPRWLQRAGYRTAHVGKYLNNYAKSLDRPAGVPPGWDEWFTVLEPERYSGYSVSDNGREVRYGNRPRDHLTRVLNDRAVELAGRLAREEAPFYLQLDYFAPHVGKGATSGACPGGAAPEPRDLGRFGADELPPKGSFDQVVSDKSFFIRALPRLRRGEARRIRRLYRCALDVLAGVDRGVGRLVAALEEAGELDDTAIVFTSDNGYFYGEHRIASGKHYPYEEAIRVPLVIRPPAVLDEDRGSRSDAAVANIDLAPTLLDFASADPCATRTRCRVLDGRSMVPLLAGASSAWPADRPLLIELDLPPSNPRARSRPCRYKAVRTAGHLYVNYTSAGLPNRPCEEVDEEELYSLADDPHQTRNRLAKPARADLRLRSRLRSKLSRLAACKGTRPAPGGCP